MPEFETRLVFSGATALLRAFHILNDGGYSCAIVAAPEGGSPCGMSVAVNKKDLPDILMVLSALHAAPVRTAAGDQDTRGGCGVPVFVELGGAEGDRIQQ